VDTQWKGRGGDRKNLNNETNNLTNLLRCLKEAKAEYAKRVLSSTSSRRVKVPLALK